MIYYFCNATVSLAIDESILRKPSRRYPINVNQNGACNSTKACFRAFFYCLKLHFLQPEQSLLAADVAGGYALLARKRVATLTPIETPWRARPRPRGARRV